MARVPGWAAHGLATLPSLAFLAFGVVREANQNGGLAGMGLHSWAEALGWFWPPFVLTLIVVAVVDLRRRGKRG